MALIVPGPAVALASGKAGGVVFSRGRGGPYIRNYAIPITVTSARALAVKSAFSLASQAWNSLAANSRTAWDQYALENPIINRIGQQRTMKGQHFYVGLSTRMRLVGDTPAGLPPVVPAPIPGGVTAVDVDVNGSVADITLTASTDDANIRAVVYACRAVSPTKLYVENLYTHIHTSAAAPGAGDIDVSAGLIAALGAIQEGVTYHFRVEFQDTRNGLVSSAQFISTVAVDTTP